MRLGDMHNMLFDFDGTLADSSPLHAQAIRDVLAVERPDLLANFSYEPLKGLTTSEAFRRLGVTDELQLSCCVTAKQQRYRDFVRAGRLALLPGAHATLDAARAGKRRLFLVTSGSSGSVMMALAKLGIVDLFDAIVTSDDVTRGKPAPDAYVFCLRNHGLVAAQSVAIEDATSGVRSARDAGLAVVGVNDPRIAPVVDWFFPDLSVFAAALAGHFSNGLPR